MDPDKFLGVLKGLIGLSSQTKKAVHVFRYEPKDFPPCHTRVLRAGRGFPWNKQIAGHRDFSGHFELKAWEEPPAGDQKRLK